MQRLQQLAGTLTLAGALLVTACGGSDPVRPPESPLAGLVERSPTDDNGNPPPAGDPGPGAIQGTVLGESAPGAGNDSLETAPRVSGANITAYPVLSGSGTNAELDDPIASTQTGADGKFNLPSLPSGDYVITVIPPTGSGYTGVWILANINTASSDHPWLVVLDKP